MISYEHVTKRFGGTTAVEDVTFRIDEGECVAFLGPNGAGKTTLVRLLLDFTRPTAGAITVRGIASTDIVARAGIGYLPEIVRLPPRLSVRRYLMRCASIVGVPAGRAADVCHAALDQAGMSGKEDVLLGACSKGMAQRVALAAALLGEPRMVILDEPTAGLDPIGMREVRLILEALKKDGVTILLNSHLLSEVERVCDSALIIHKGCLLVKGAIATLVQQGETLEDLFVRLVKAGPS